MDSGHRSRACEAYIRLSAAGLQVRSVCVCVLNIVYVKLMYIYVHIIKANTIQKKKRISIESKKKKLLQMFRPAINSYNYSGGFV